MQLGRFDLNEPERPSGNGRHEVPSVVDGEFTEDTVGGAVHGVVENFKPVSRARRIVGAVALGAAEVLAATVVNVGINALRHGRWFWQNPEQTKGFAISMVLVLGAVGVIEIGRAALRRSKK